MYNVGSVRDGSRLSDMLTSRQIRQQFIDYFVQQHGHTVVPSSSVVPHDDPTLLFTNAGMNQFKDIFLGTGRRDYNRAVNTQKCIRAGGKHNDLEDVGKDTYHHTFFEMLGNWSFGDYFKREAIAWSWDLLTNVWGLPKQRLYVTVFGGDEADGIPADDESVRLWPEVTDLDPSHISRWGKKDNFWESADTGPCGLNCEIHIDLTPGAVGGSLVNQNNPRVVELWNLVFIQFNRDATGRLEPLPDRHVDTGLGFERICAVLQEKTSNYDTDVFTAIFDAIRDVTGARSYDGTVERTMQDSIDIAYRVLADHGRCLTMAITDGALPSNEGRGYVLRRILRRAVRHGWQTLNVTEPFLYRLVPAVVESLVNVFPELKSNTENVAAVIREEEQSFGRTLDRGIALFEKAAAPGTQIRDDDAFTLHDTYGFPLDLTQTMAEERGMTVDVEGFKRRMEQARQIARGATGQTARDAGLIEIVRNGPCEPTQCVGYEQTECTVETYCELFRVEEKGVVPGVRRLELAEAGLSVAVIVGSTLFYAEAGGQVGDQGTIEDEAGGVLRIQDCVKVGDVYIHLGMVESGPWQPHPPDDKPVRLTMRVDKKRRAKIMSSHTTTHMMNRALRVCVSPTIDQKGSLVDDEKLRFDFAHGTALSQDQIDRVESTVNADIAADLPVYTGTAPQEAARQIYGLRAVFGERYPDVVRIVCIGQPVSDLLADPSNDEWVQISIELCGGTHLQQTGDAEAFVIVSEDAVAKGVRRITALTGRSAHEASAHGDLLLSRLEMLKGRRPEALAEQIASLRSTMDDQPIPLLTRAKLRNGIGQLQVIAKQHQKQQGKQAEDAVVDVARKLAERSDENIIVASVEGADRNTLRTAMDVIRKKKPDAALLLGAVAEDKVAFLASVPKSLIARGLKAGDWVKEAAKIAGGAGGGRPDMAQAGGKDPEKLVEALEAGRAFAARNIG